MSLEPTHDFRFKRAIYLHYVEVKRDNELEISHKVQFSEVIAKLVQTKKTIEFDKKNIYRLADTKEIWYDKYNRILGEIWREDDVVSYWINKEYVK